MAPRRVTSSLVAVVHYRAGFPLDAAPGPRYRAATTRYACCLRRRPLNPNHNLARDMARAIGKALGLPRLNRRSGRAATTAAGVDARPLDHTGPAPSGPEGVAPPVASAGVSPGATGAGRAVTLGEQDLAVARDRDRAGELAPPGERRGALLDRRDGGRPFRWSFPTRAQQPGDRHEQRAHDLSPPNLTTTVVVSSLYGR